MSTTTRRGRHTLEYIPPEGSSETSPPHDSTEITRWMVLDGRRVQRHASHAEAWKAARDKILRAAAFMLLTMAILISAAGALVGGVTLLAFYLISPAAALPAATLIVGVVIGFLLGGILALFWPRRFGDPLDLVPDRYDLSYDEFEMSLVVVAGVVTPLCLLAYVAFV